MSMPRCVLRILKCIAVVHFLIEVDAAFDQDGDLEKFYGNGDKRYSVNGRWSVKVPRQILLMPLHELPSRWKQKIDGNNQFQSTNLLSSWNENEFPGAESKLDGRTDFWPSMIKRFSWQPIFDAKIIAAIGALFTQRIKNESNRERLEEEKLREIELLKNLTKIMQDPWKLEILKRQSKNAPRVVEQTIH